MVNEAISLAKAIIASPALIDEGDSLAASSSGTTCSSGDGLADRNIEDADTFCESLNLRLQLNRYSRSSSCFSEGEAELWVLPD